MFKVYIEASTKYESRTMRSQQDFLLNQGVRPLIKDEGLSQYATTHVGGLAQN